MLIEEGTKYSNFLMASLSLNPVEYLRCKFKKKKVHKKATPTKDLITVIQESWKYFYKKILL